MTTIFTLCHFIIPAMFKPDDEFLIVRIIDLSTCFKRNCTAVYSDSYSDN